MVEVKFEQISPADFFYRNRDIAGFSSPARSLYMSIRELVENSLDACEVGRILPEVSIELSLEGTVGDSANEIYRLVVRDNGIGVDGEYIPKAFGTILFGSKYGFKQSRGTFGVGGTMALLHGQITTNRPFRVISSRGGAKIYEYELMIDIVANEPRIIEKKVHENKDNWRGTIIDFTLEADYSTSRSKIIEYLKMTSLINPHANISFIDPKGRFYFFRRFTNEVPEPPKEAKPHPLGVDAETVSRMAADTKTRTVLRMLIEEFQRVGEKTALDVLKLAGIDPQTSPSELTHEQIAQLVGVLRSYKGFRAPDTSSLSPVGSSFLEAGVKALLRPEFHSVVQRPPSSYSGIPFIVEVAVAWGGAITPSEDILLYRFANKIPLLYDERADVSWKVISEKIDWAAYKVPKLAPLAVITSICSPKIPYKTVGKEAIADRPEIERELTLAIRESARHLRNYLSRLERREAVIKRLNIYAKYLPKIAKFSAELADREPPEIKGLLKKIGVTDDMLKEAERSEAQEAEQIS
ncbi:MAG: DNA topoisomerase VI subunit B [Nitrososphaerota archaeon]|nr:DNA topoisomerase VI subunit B [Candidatus Calditenuaceae archaeon]MDW8072929.1 DNA topoisomerase VI subunit B [Nitrososphaerota archaeon]